MSGNAIQHFITRWSAASASERANSQPFLSELCDVLEVSRPEPTFTGGYAFESPVAQEQRDGSVTEGRIDLYKRGCFVLESKQFHAAQPEATSLQLALEVAEGGASSLRARRGEAQEPSEPAADSRPGGRGATRPTDPELFLASSATKKRKPSGPTRGTDRWEEAEGLVRWLRPEYQNPGAGGTSFTSPQLNLPPGTAPRGKKKTGKGQLGTRETRPSKAAKKPWPKTLAERVKAVSDALRAAEVPMTPAKLTQHFLRAKPEDVAAILETLVVRGQARRAKGTGRYVG